MNKNIKNNLLCVLVLPYVIINHWHFTATASDCSFIKRNKRTYLSWIWQFPSCYINSLWHFDFVLSLSRWRQFRLENFNENKYVATCGAPILLRHFDSAFRENRAMRWAYLRCSVAGTWVNFATNWQPKNLHKFLLVQPTKFSPKHCSDTINLMSTPKTIRFTINIVPNLWDDQLTMSCWISLWYVTCNGEFQFR